MAAAVPEGSEPAARLQRDPAGLPVRAGQRPRRLGGAAGAALAARAELRAGRRRVGGTCPTRRRRPTSRSFVGARLLREFEGYLSGTGKLTRFRSEAVRAGFDDAWDRREFDLIVKIGKRLPSDVLVEDPTLRYFVDNAELLVGGMSSEWRWWPDGHETVRVLAETGAGPTATAQIVVPSRGAVERVPAAHRSSRVASRPWSSSELVVASGRGASRGGARTARCRCNPQPSARAAAPSGGGAGTSAGHQPRAAALRRRGRARQDDRGRAGHQRAEGPRAGPQDPDRRPQGRAAPVGSRRWHSTSARSSCWWARAASPSTSGSTRGRPSTRSCARSTRSSRCALARDGSPTGAASSTGPASRPSSRWLGSRRVRRGPPRQRQHARTSPGTDSPSTSPRQRRTCCSCRPRRTPGSPTRSPDYSA